MKGLEDLFSKNSVSLADGESYFFYDLSVVKDNVKKLRSMFKSLSQIYFSVKSNPSPVILKNLESLNVNFDVSSEKELRAAYVATSDYSKITISGPAKTDAFIKFFKNKNVCSVHIDSFEEYRMLENSKTSISIRWPLESNYSQKVGLPIQDLEKIVKLAENGRKLSGIHIYIGRERATVDLVEKKLSEIRKFVKAHSKSFQDRPNLFWGAGLPLINHVESGFIPTDPFFSVHLECGRALVHNSAVYVTQVLETKEKLGERIVIINGGLQHLASHFGSPRFGQDDVSVFLPNRNSIQESNANIYGSLGTVTDILVRDVPISKDLKRGDWIAIGPAGGYGYTAGTSQFLGPHRPIEIFFEGNQIQIPNTNSLNYLEAGVYETQSIK